MISATGRPQEDLPGGFTSRVRRSAEIRLWNASGKRLRELAWPRLSPASRSAIWLSQTAPEQEAWLARLPLPDQERLWSELDDELQSELVWPVGAPREAWHSFDRHPWQHPWVTAGNLRSFRAFSDGWIDALVQRVERSLDRPGRRYAFVCNLANNLYSRARAMAARPVHIDVFPHPHDRYIMSHPEWEEYEGEAIDGIEDLDAARAAGMLLPDVPRVRHVDPLPAAPSRDSLPAWVRLLDHERWQAWFTYLPMLEALQAYDALLSMQAPYLAYLSGRPYVATQMGGEIWYECSRDDAYGRLQRQAFRCAGAFLVSNPWSLAFARRYGLTNLVYLPYQLDDQRYSPGPGSVRSAWQAATGGDFFVLMTSRQDYRFKGSDAAIRGFARFAASAPGARLVVTAWGADRDKAMKLFASLGIADRVHLVPIVGKKRLVDYLRSADCTIDQLTLGYFGASALETFACGRPVVMNLNRTQYDALIPEGSAPVCQAASEEDVSRELLRLYSDRAAAAAAGDALRQWFLLTHGNRRWARVYDAILAGTAAGRLPGFDGSPLHAGWDNAEVAYHSAELAAAPVFPNYF